MSQDTEGRVPCEPLHFRVVRWDGLHRGGHEGRQHLQDGRPQVPL